MGEVKVVNTWQGEMEIHGSPFTLKARVTKLEGSLQDEEKRYKVAFNYVEEKTCQLEEH